MAVDLIAIGDPTIDTFVRIHDAHLALRLHPDRTELCINYADKIPVDELHRSPAGNAVNAAFAASAAGLQVALYGVTGADAEGRSIREDLQAAGVDTSLMEADRLRSTNASTALVFRGERTLFVWHQRRTYHLPRLPEAAWVYATSVGPAGPHVEKLHRDLCGQLAHHPTRLAFSPGTHQLRMGARALAPLLHRSDLLVLNREEAIGLTGCHHSAPKDLLRGLVRLGPRMAVMTDGVHGSYGYDGELFLKSGIFRLPVVDRTGAGDAYGATVTSALHSGADLGTAMAWATVQAAYVVSAMGARRGLVGRRRLKATVREHPELVAREV